MIRICLEKKLDPIPFLIGLACGSNIGSAITLIGNPQNMLIGQYLNIPFAQYTLDALVPCIAGLFVTWWVIKLYTKNQWHEEKPKIEFETPAVDRWQSCKGVIVIVLLLGIFLIFDVPRENISLMAAGCLLLSRQMTSRMMLNFIDWQLLVLFIGLFIVNQEFHRSEIMQSFLHDLQKDQVNLYSPVPIFIMSVLLSNLISNVPAVMLLVLCK